MRRINLSTPFYKTQSQKSSRKKVSNKKRKKAAASHVTSVTTRKIVLTVESHKPQEIGLILVKMLSN